MSQKVASEFARDVFFGESSRWLNARECAQYIRRSSSSLAALRTRGDGPPFRRVGNRVVYDRSEVDEWIQALPSHKGTFEYDPRSCSHTRGKRQQEAVAQKADGHGAGASGQVSDAP